jgi:threonine dehydratase
MLAGISAYVKQVRPSVKIYGVEAADAAGMTASLAAGKVVTLPSVGLFADGAAVKTVGSNTFQLCQKYVDGMVTVDTDQICNAIKLAYNDARVVLEPAGALAVAGLKKYVEENNITGSTFVSITSGANMDFNRLRVVSERADDSERSLEITIPESPGAFRAMYSTIWPRNVTELTYRYNTEHEANVFVSFQPLTHVENDFEQVIEELKAIDFPCTDLSDNELAKTHIRHLAGGRSHAPYESSRKHKFASDSLEVSNSLVTSLLFSPREHCSVSWNLST